MPKLITTIFGAGIFGSIVALRKYVGIVLVMIVSTMIFKADIVEYIKQSSKQSHEQKLAEISLETERLKIEAETKVLREQKEKAEIELYNKERERLQKEQEQKLKAERLKIAEEQRENNFLKQDALKTICNTYESDYKKQMYCAATPNHYSCTAGYTPVAWYNGAMASRSLAINMKCNVQY